MKRKIFSILIALVLVLGFSLVTAVPVAKAWGGHSGSGNGGLPPQTDTVSWLEDAVRYNPDGSEAGSWANDPIGPADLVCTGKAYHFADIEQFYNQTLPDVSGSVVISGGGKLSGHATYTSLRSSLPIRERFRGEVTIDVDADPGIMEGTYTQWSYAFGPKDDVLEWYPQAVPAKKQGSGWWFIGYTVYDAHQ